MIRGFFGFLGEADEPIRRINAFSVERDATDDHGDAGLQAAIGYLQDVAVLTQIDCDASGLGMAREQSLTFLDGYQLGHCLMQTQGESPEIAFSIRSEAAQPRGLHVEIDIGHDGAHIAEDFSIARWLTPCILRTRRSRTSASLASRSRSPAATSRSISITSFMVRIVSSATRAST